MWDPEKRCVVGLMCVTDYIQALQVLRQHNMPILELASKSINDIVSSAMVALSSNRISYMSQTGSGEALSIDAEDSVLQLVMLLDRLGTDYIPVVNPDEGNIVSVLGYSDVLNLLHVATKQQPQLFIHNVQTILTEQSRLNNNMLITAPRTAKLTDVIHAMFSRGLIAVPVVDELTNQVLGIYHKSDVTFIVRAADPDAVLTNLANMSVGEVLLANQQQYQQAIAPELITKVYNLVKVRPHDNLASVIESLINGRITIAVCVNEADVCIGMVTIKDILRHFFPGNTS